MKDNKNNNSVFFQRVKEFFVNFFNAPDEEVENEFDSENIELLPSSKKAYKHRKVWFPVLKSIGWAALIIALALFLSISILQGITDIFGFEKESEAFEITLTGNENLSDILKILNERDIVTQPTAFRLYSTVKHWKKSSFEAGTYTIKSNMSYDEIISLFKMGMEKDDIVTVTIPEGLSVYEIAVLLEENGVCSAEKFISALETSEFGYEFVDLIPQSELRFRKFEGYLFPDTYEFYIGENPVSVAKKFLRNFNTRVTSAYYDRFKELDLSLDEVITLASIIQKEAGKLEQMYRVSSVFHNRLKSKNYPHLQSDTTINYINNYIKPFLASDNQSMYDAYNTEVCKGLPIGPITNPGLDAIKAALYPANTSYYYFVSDVNGEYYYAKTLSQHEANISMVKKINAAAASKSDN